MELAAYIAAEKAAEKTAAYLTDHLRAAARTAAWSDDLADCLTVKYLEGTFDVHFPLKNGREVWDEEDKTHVIRRFMNRAEALGGRYYIDEVVRNLSSAGVI